MILRGGMGMGVDRQQGLNSRSVREGISLMSMSKSDLSRRWRRVLYLPVRFDWLDPAVLPLFGRRCSYKSRRRTGSPLRLFVTDTLPLLRHPTVISYPEHSWALRIHLAEIDAVPAWHARFLWRVVSASTVKQLSDRVVARGRSGVPMW